MYIQYSPQDKKREIKIPTSLTSELAEFIGIMVGDGNIYMNTSKYRSKYEIRIAGHFHEDREYHKRRVTFLLKKIFNVKHPIEIIRKANMARYIGIGSKAI